MSDAAKRDNVHSLVDGHLIRAKQHAANAEGHDKEEMTARERKIAEWARCADEIIAAKEAAKAEGRKLTNVDVGRAMGWPVRKTENRRDTWRCDKVERLLAWRNEAHGLPPHSPFGGPKQAEHDRNTHARSAVRHNVNTVIAEAKKHPDIARRIRDELDEFLSASEPDECEDNEPEPTEEPPTARSTEPRMSKAESMAYVNDLLRKAREKEAAEERAEREAERKEQEEFDRERAAHRATPVGTVENACSHMLLPRFILGPVMDITPELISRLTPEERAEWLPVLAERLEEFLSPVEAALAACRAAMSNE